MAVYLSKMAATMFGPINLCYRKIAHLAQYYSDVDLIKLPGAESQCYIFKTLETAIQPYTQEAPLELSL